MDLNFSKLKLNGFKSFVDSTEFDIFPGLTGIVGPNGCGKSNLLEAIRWVMGENRPSAMRGIGMDEVIFDGAGTRPSKNHAEVSIEVERDNLLPNQIDKKITFEILRKVTRNMGSTYRIDGNLSRLKDVQMIFADASTGAHSPSLVKQGQISELINSNPKSRRVILEEAAGISGLHQRRHEAELKLKATEGNLIKVQDILDSLSSQLHALSKQAKQAKKYKELLGELKKNERFLSFFDWQSLRDECSQHVVLFSDLVKKINQKEKELESFKLTLSKEEKKLPFFRDELFFEKSGYEKLLVEKENLNKSEEQNLNLVKNLNESLSVLESDKKREEILLNDAEDALKKLNWELSNIESFFSNVEEKILKNTKLCEEYKNELKIEEIKLEEESLKFLQLKSIISDNSEVLSQIENSEKEIKNSKNKYLLELNELRAEEEKLKLNILKLTDKNCEDKEKINVLLENLQKSFKIKDQCLQKEDFFSKKLYASKNLINSFEEKLKNIQNLLSNSDSSKSILDKIEVEKGYEKALIAALHDDLNFPISEDKKNSGWLNINNSNGFIFQNLDSLLDKVKCPKALNKSLSYVAIAQENEGFSLQTKLKPGQRVVSLSGDLWRWDGFVRLAKDLASNSDDILKWRSNSKILSKDLKKEKDKYEILKNNYTKIKEELDKSTFNEEEIRKMWRSKDEEMLLDSQKLNQLNIDSDLIEKKIINHELLLKNFEEERKLLEKKKKKISFNDEEIKKCSDLAFEIENFKNVVEEKRKKMVEKKNNLENLKKDKKINLKKIEEIKQDLFSWNNRKKVAFDRIEDFKKRKQLIKDKIKNAVLFPNTLKEQRKKNELKMIESQKKCEKIQIKVEEHECLLKKLSFEEKEHLNALSFLNQDFARVENQTSNLNNLREESKKKFVEKFGEQPEIFFDKNKSILDTVDYEKLEIKIDELKRKRDYLGEVNLRAENDALEISKEYEELEKEKDDISKAIDKLRSAISDLNKKGKNKLNTAFEKVNNNFSDLFKNLFDGGEAELKLIPGDDPLDTGLEIMCQPPGKKLSNLSLLSGGEQTLAALSLILAVFLARPSPICVLDEVDAPLDEANVSRFCKLLNLMKQKTKTRFLIITHHAITMAKMDRLYGVTMVEKGVSKLVSVDLKKAENFARNKN